MKPMGRPTQCGHRAFAHGCPACVARLRARQRNESPPVYRDLLCQTLENRVSEQYDKSSKQQVWPHGYSCWCPTCAPIHKADEIRMLIDTCRRSGSDSIERRLVDHIDALEGAPTVLTASWKCPLCGFEGSHPHTPLEQTIYRNGVKAGRTAVETTRSPGPMQVQHPAPCWCPYCGEPQSPAVRETRDAVEPTQKPLFKPGDPL
jgi:hypothetical protein